jgi:hypothetical protein
VGRSQKELKISWDLNCPHEKKNSIAWQSHANFCLKTPTMENFWPHPDNILDTGF